MRPWVPSSAICEAPAQLTRFNLVVLPRAHAYEYLAFCSLNPQACSVVSVGEVGSPILEDMSRCDVRTAAGCYDVIEHGCTTRQISNLTDAWREDFVAIAIGCSLALDTLLLEQGICPKHLRTKSRVPVFRTARKARSVGLFSSNLFVTMRVFSEAEVVRVCQISGRYPVLHGSPVHVGAPEPLGIDPQPVLGDPVLADVGELAVYWGCGVTAATALQNANLPLAFKNSDMNLCVSRLPLHTLASS